MKLKLLILLMVSIVASEIYGQQWGDYTLYSISNSTSSSLLDTNGNVVKTWNHGTTKTGYSCYLMPGGYLWRTVARTGNSFSGGPICGQVQKVDWAGNVVWDFVYSTTDYCTHHDICPLPNGNVLLIAYERKTAAEVTAAGCTFNGEMWPDKIVEVKPTGATTGDVVWEWKIWDHILQTTSSSKPNYQTSILDHPELLNVNYLPKKDWIHMNGIDYNPILDQITFSSRYMNEWYIIDHSTTTAEAASHSGGNSGKGGDFLYRWGNPAAYGATGTTVLKVTHDAHWIPEGMPNSGRLVGLNNQGVSTSKSAVDQIVTPVNGYNYNGTPGSAYEPSTYTRHACNGYTSNAGCSEQLPNGNMFVCLAIPGTLYEIDPSGNTIWTKTVSGSTQQAHRYEKCFTDNAPPPIPTITQRGTKLVTAPATTYQWYMNGQKLGGQTDSQLTPTKAGVYLVRTTDKNGCVYQYSKGFKITPPFSITLSATKTTLCLGQNTNISSSHTGETGLTTFQWSSFPLGFSSTQQNVMVSPVTTTTYKVVSTYKQYIDSASVTIQVNPKPLKPTLTKNGTTLTSSVGTNYYWYEDTVLINGANLKDYTPLKTGAFRVKIADSNGCISDFSDPFEFTAKVASKSAIHFSISPNPCLGELRIHADVTLKNLRFVIFNSLGEIVMDDIVSNTIHLQHLHSGIYYIRVSNGDFSSFPQKLMLLKND